MCSLLAYFALAHAGPDAEPEWDVPYQGVLYTRPLRRADARPGRRMPTAPAESERAGEPERLAATTPEGLPLPDPRASPPVRLDESAGVTYLRPRPPIWARAVLGVVGGVAAVGLSAVFTSAVGGGLEP